VWPDKFKTGAMIYPMEKAQPKKQRRPHEVLKKCGHLSAAAGDLLRKLSSNTDKTHVREESSAAPRFLYLAECAIQHLVSSVAPHGRKPRLLRARQPGRAIVMLQLDEARRLYQPPPGVERVKAAVAAIGQPFLIAAAWVRGKQHATWLERCGDLAQHPGQFQARHMEQGCVGEHAIEPACRQIQRKKILVQDLASGLIAGHGDECRRTIQPNGFMSQ
jgi:hypothetical protein